MSIDSSTPPRAGSGAARRAKSAKHKAHHATARRPLVIIGGVVAVVALALVIAIAAGGDEAKTPTTEGILETRPVTITGEALPKLPDSGDDTAAGLLAPTISGATFAGAPIAVPATGKPTLTIFVAHWCPHCRREVPLLTEWAKAGRVPTGVEVLAVATSTDPASVNYPPSAWLATEGFPFAVLADSSRAEAAAAMGVTGYPFFVMTDADGKVRWRASGEIPMDALTTMITDSLAG